MEVADQCRGPSAPCRYGADVGRSPRDDTALSPVETVRRVGSPTLLVTLGILPVFLVSSLAVLVREDLFFSEARLGLAIAGNFAASALMSAPAGRLTQRMGSRVGFTIGCVLVGGALVGLALTTSWALLAGWLVLAGLGNAFMQVAANLRIARVVRSSRHGFAFGVKQSAIPAATLVAGMAVPVIGVTIGWRPAFASAAIGVALAAVSQRAPMDTRAAADRSSVGRTVGPALLLLTLGIAFAAAAATSLGAFLVSFAVSEGWSASNAGLLLAAGSLGCILARLWLGWYSDRWRRDGLRIVTIQLAVGSVALAALGSGGALGPVLVLAAFLAFGVGWGWSGVFNHSIVSRAGTAPAAVTGVTQAGIYAGGGAGPLAFGAVAGLASYRSAWLLASACMAVAAVLIALGRRLAGDAPLAAT
jgi:MFS family permease